MELVADLTAAGKIRRFGIGVEELTEAAPWLDVPGLHSVELPFSMLDRSAAPVIAVARERGVSVVARSVLGGGSIARATTAPGPSATAGPSLLDDLRQCAQRCDMTLVQLAVAFASGHPGIDVVLVGVRIPEHLVGLLGAASFSTPERDVLDQIDSVIASHPTPGDPQVG
jgi:aryl-alcohol dehydrogenase-like predicted oxidoreductase